MNHNAARIAEEQENNRETTPEALKEVFMETAEVLATDNNQNG